MGKSTIMREVVQFWDFDGNLLAENDSYVGGKDTVERRPLYSDNRLPKDFPKSTKEKMIDQLRGRIAPHMTTASAKTFDGRQVDLVIDDFELSIPAYDEKDNRYEAYVTRFFYDGRVGISVVDLLQCDRATNSEAYRRACDDAELTAMYVDPQSIKFEDSADHWRARS